MIGCILLGLSPTAQAGGPKLIGSPSFGVNGQPFVWDNSQTIQYRTDRGALGSMDNATANSNLAQSFAAWTRVPTALLSVQNVGTIPGVANGHVSSVAD